jgi:hypothetical protein
MDTNSPSQAVQIDRQYQALLAQIEVVTADDLKKKNKLYREYRKFCQSGVVGKSVK